MSSAEIYQLDGVPVFLDEARGEPGRGYASIRFRVGDYDEVLACAGVTQFVHNLIRASAPAELIDYVETSNDGLFTRISIDAPVEQLSRCVSAIADAVVDPNWEYLDRVAQLLAADPSPRAWVYESAALNLRYGTAGPGTLFQEMWAVTHARREVVEGWLRERFCRENAAIVLYTSDVILESFKIPSGRARDVLLNEPLALNLPAYFAVDDLDSVTYQFTTSPGAIGQLAGRLVAQLIDRRVTKLEFLAPKGGFNEELLDSSVQCFTGAFPIPPENRSAVVTAIVETISDVAHGHIGEEIYETMLENFRRSCEEHSDNGVDGGLAAAARLFPAVRTRGATRDELEYATAADVAEVAREFLATLVLHVPTGTAVSGDVNPGEVRPDASIDGDTFVDGGPPDRLRKVLYSRQGLTYMNGDEAITVRFAHCTAVFDTGVSYELIAPDGGYITLWTAENGGSEMLVQLVLDNVNPLLFIKREATEDELRAAAAARPHLTGWQARLVAVGKVIAPVALAVLALQQFKSSGISAAVQPLGLLAIFIGAFAWPQLKLRSRKLSGLTLGDWPDVGQYLGFTLLIGGMINTVLVLAIWELATESPPAPATPLAVVVLVIPFVVSWRKVKRSTFETSAQRVVMALRWFCIGSAIQVGVIAVIALVAYLLGVR